LPKWLRTSWLSTQVIAIVGLVMVLDFASNAYVFHEAGAFTLPHAEAEALASGLDSASNTIGTAPEPVRLELARRLSTPQLRLAWQRGPRLRRPALRFMASGASCCANVPRSAAPTCACIMRSST
jgi:hypothetical protein